MIFIIEWTKCKFNLTCVLYLGTPKHRLSVQQIIDKACEEAQVLKDHGMVTDEIYNNRNSVLNYGFIGE